MTIDNLTKSILSVIAVALLLNGLNPWINPPTASANEKDALAAKDTNKYCSSAKKNSVENLKETVDIKRLLGYIQSTVNDIDLAVMGIDRKINYLPSSNKENKKE
ncbi:MAG: hypothetical protein ACQ9MH_12035 [Nitrospinales bacterium]